MAFSFSFIFEFEREEVRIAASNMLTKVSQDDKLSTQVCEKNSWKP